MSVSFAVFIMIWVLIMVTLMFIGGFFMFRKFLKRLPKEDGKSLLDWEEYYVKKTRKMWTAYHLELLEELVSPVPEIFRDVARQKIAGKIGELAIEKKTNKISQELLIEGYIRATPKRDHRFLVKKLTEKNIDIAPYAYLLDKQERA